MGVAPSLASLEQQIAELETFLTVELSVLETLSVLDKAHELLRLQARFHRGTLTALRALRRSALHSSWPSEDRETLAPERSTVGTF